MHTALPTSPGHWVGVDISKEHLDVHCLQLGQTLQ